MRRSSDGTARRAYSRLVSRTRYAMAAAQTTVIMRPSPTSYVLRAKFSSHFAGRPRCPPVASPPRSPRARGGRRRSPHCAHSRKNHKGILRREQAYPSRVTLFRVSGFRQLPLWLYHLLDARITSLSLATSISDLHGAPRINSSRPCHVWLFANDRLGVA